MDKMNQNKKPIEFSKSSLLSLKAEVLRKQQEVKNSKLSAAYVRTQAKGKQKLFKNPGIDERNAKDEIEPVDEDVLKKSRIMLEAKTKLYDKLSKSKDSDPDCNFLVQFDNKSRIQPVKHIEDDRNSPEQFEEEPPDPDNEWIEYKDYLGRSRTCLKKDLPEMQAQSKNMEVAEPEVVEERDEIETKDVSTERDEDEIEFEKTSNELKEEWEKREEENAHKKDIHYQDVLFNEARAHGVGYYNFSFDEEERAKQQQNLKNLRNETKSKQQTVQQMREMREKQLAARTKAARNRKRARMGLPPETEEDEPKPDPDESEQIGPLPIAIDKIKEEEDKAKQKLRDKHIRPWDIGKEGVITSTSKPIQTQEQWIDNKRNERLPEFAPPSEAPPPFRPFQIPEPQQLYEEDVNTSLFFTTKTKKTKPSNFYESAPEEISKSNYKRSYYEEEPHTQPAQPAYKRRNENVIDYIQNEVSEGVDHKYDPFNASDDSGEDDAEDPAKNEPSWRDASKYASIPPPPTFEYYGPTATSSKSSSKKTNVGEIQASIEAGLRFLRKQSERKHAHTDNVGYFE